MNRSIALGAPTTLWGLPPPPPPSDEVSNIRAAAASSCESLVECHLSPSGQLYAILTQSRLQFWSSMQHTILLATVMLPRCSPIAGGDAGHRVVWNPAGRSLAVATLDRRIIFVEADIHLNNATVVAPADASGRVLQVVDAPTRVCLGFEIQLEFGLVIGLAAAPQALLVSTSSGFVVGVGWNRGSVLFTWSSTHVLQRACASPMRSASSGTLNSGLADTVDAPSSIATAAPLPMATTNNNTSSSNSGGGVGGQSSSHRLAYGGSITFFAHTVSHRISSFVLADGTFGFLRSSAASLDTPPAASHDGVRNGVCHTGYGALMVSINPICCVVAISTQPQSSNESGGAVLRILPFDPKTLDVGGHARKSSDRLPSAAAGHGGEGGGDQDLLSRSWCDDKKSLGGVRAMEWSSDGTMLAVCFRKRGVVVFHCTGVCVFASFRRFEGVSHGSAHILGASLERGGCLSAVWDATGHRLLCFGPDSPQIVLVPFVRVVSSYQDSNSESNGSQPVAVVAYGPTSVSWLQLDGSDEAGELAPTWESVECPSDYVASNYPIRYAAVCGDGVHVVCAGTYGAVILSRRLRRWRLFSVESQERQLSCVADPCWLNGLVVALPVRHHTGPASANTGNYEVVLYPRFHLHDNSLVHRIRCEQRPTMLSATPERSGSPVSLMIVLEGSCTLSLFSVEILADDLITPRDVRANVSKLRSLTLAGKLEDPLSLQWCPTPPMRRLGGLWSNHSHRRHADPAAAGGATPPPSPPSPPPQRRAVVVPWVLLTTGQHNLVCVDINDASVTQLSLESCGVHQLAHPRGSPVFRVWCGDALFSQVFPTSTMLLTHDRGEISIWWLETQEETQQQQAVRHPPQVSWCATVAELDDGACLPIAMISQEGAVGLVTEGLDAAQPIVVMPAPSSGLPCSPPPPRQQPSIRRVLYAHHAALRYFLSSTKLAATSKHSDSSSPERRGDDSPGERCLAAECCSTQFDAAVQRLREQGAFVGVMDYLLHLVLHSDETCPPGVVVDPSGGVPPSSSVSSSSITATSRPPVVERDRRALLWTIIQFLKRYWEYHTTVVGLVRKVDMSKWRLIFDVIGAPVDFFDDCLSSGRLVEAAHVVRVVMMDAVTQHTIALLEDHHAPSSLGAANNAGGGRDVTSLLSPSQSKAVRRSGGSASDGRGRGDGLLRVLSPLEAAAHCALRLFPLVLAKLDAVFASELFRFLSMILMELSGTAAANAAADFGGAADSGNSLVAVGAIKEATPSSSRWRSLWPFSSKSSAPSPARDGSVIDQSVCVSGNQCELKLPLAVPLDISFTSPHKQDNAASALLLSTFPSVKEAMTRVFLNTQFLDLRLCSFLQSVFCFSLDLHRLVSSFPWPSLVVLWIRRSAPPCNGCEHTPPSIGSNSPPPPPMTETTRTRNLRRYMATQLQRDAHHNRAAMMAAMPSGGEAPPSPTRRRRPTFASLLDVLRSVAAAHHHPDDTGKQEEESAEGRGGAAMEETLNVLITCIAKLVERVGGV